MVGSESESLEFKKSTAQLREGVVSLSAMLNKHGKGTVLFGVNDDGEVTGQVIGKMTKADIVQEISNHLKPMPVVTVKEQTIEGKTIISLDAEGEDTPYSAYGRYYIRTDDSDIQMSSNQLWRFFEEKDRTYSKWEETDSGKGIAIVDEDVLIEYIRDANDTGRMDYVYRNPVEALSKLNLLCENGDLNNAGYYLFGADGPVLLREVIYPTDDRTTFTDLKQFRGNIIQCIREAVKYIQNNIHYNAEIVGTRRVQTPEIPSRALREIVINSFVHCRYQKGDSNEVAISKSSVKIYNPGPMIMDTDPQDFATGRIGSKIRNPLIATVLFKNALIDAFGTGFDRAFRACNESGVRYHYFNDEFGFTFIFARRKDAVTGATEAKRIYDIRPTSEFEKEIISEMAANPYTTIPELSNKLSKSTATVHRHIENLYALNKVRREGARKNGYWVILDD